MRKEQHFLNGTVVGHQHHQTVDTNPNPGGGGHAVFECAQEILIDKHGFVIAFFAQGELGFEAFALVDGVVQLGVGVGQFFAVDHEFKPFGEARIAAVFLGQGAHFLGVVGNEGGLNVVVFAFLPKDFIDEFPHAHAFVYFDVEALRGLSQLLLVHTGHVNAGVGFDGFQDGHPRVGRLKID